MRITTAGQTTARTLVTPIGVVAGGLGLVLLLLLTHAATRLIDGTVQLDQNLLILLNGLARGSRAFDLLVWGVSSDVFLQGGVLVALFWWAWFSSDDTLARQQQKRATLLASFVGVYVSVFLALVLRVVLPFRSRPIMDAALGLKTPYLPDYVTLSPNSTSFPSGHAITYLALVVGLWLISTKLGFLGLLHAVVTVCLPRMYFGFHYPSDILGAGVVAIVTVASVTQLLQGRSFLHHVVVWADRRPAAFYSLLFLCSLDIAMEFANVKGILHLVGGVQLTKIAGL